MSTGPDPSPTRMLLRGILRRCPWCGDRRAYFTGWFSKQPGCRRCAMPWRRDDVGFELGAVVVSTIITFGLIIVTMVVGLVASAPDFAVVPIVVVLLAVAVAVPVLVYPLSYTVWQAIDLIMRPPHAHRRETSG